MESFGMAQDAHLIYIKSGDISDPSNKWVVVDEHPDSMNDGCFFTNMTTSNPSYVDLWNHAQ